MDCTTLKRELLSYHLAVQQEEATRHEIDAHLFECKTCLAAYLALKHALDASRDARASERPSRSTRERLRASVTATFAKRDDVRDATRTLGLTPARIPLWKRPVPLYQSIIAVALAAAVTLVLPTIVDRLGKDARRADVGDGIPQVDTSRSGPRSLSIY